MQPSYEGLDRPGGFTRVRLLAPLAHRDYRLLIGGQSVSLLGDGLFLVALAWQVYDLSDVPTALATVGIAMTIPTIACLILGGAVSDRYDRRTVMLIADTVRAVLLAALAVLAISGAVRFWDLLLVAAGVGASTAFFNPASDAIVPQLLPADLLAQANSLDQLLRPLMLRMAGPAAGGFLVAVLGPGWAFGVDAATSLFAVILLLQVVSRSAVTGDGGEAVTSEIVAGLRYVRSRAWLWATLVSAAVAYLLFLGPTEVLLPFIVKHSFAHGAADLGLVFAVGGLGSLALAVVVGQIDLPGNTLMPMYLAWTLATLAVAGYGLHVGLWGLMLASIGFNALETVGTIAWATTKQRHVPAQLLGRVSSLDWLISIGLLPLSYALTGPVSAAIGPRATLIGAGCLGAVATLMPAFSHRVREIREERSVIDAQRYS